MRCQGRHYPLVAIAGLAELSDSREDGADEEEVRVGVRPHLQPRHEHILRLVQAGGDSGLGQEWSLTESENIFLNPALSSPGITV